MWVCGTFSGALEGFRLYTVTNITNNSRRRQLNGRLEGHCLICGSSLVMHALNNYWLQGRIQGWKRGVCQGVWEMEVPSGVQGQSPCRGDAGDILQNYTTMM